MAVRSQYAESVVSENAAAIIARLGTRLADVTRTIYHTLTTEIPELRGDRQVLELLGSSIEGNVDTIFHALQYEIPLERVQPPTAALEYARRLAQRGVPVNALVRAYRLGQQALLDVILIDIRQSNLGPGLDLDVFERMTKVISRYIDWISQQVVGTYATERDRWLENRNHVRAVRVREILDATDIDVDAMIAALGYPLRRTHLALVLWFPEDENCGGELARLERTVRELAESLDTQGNALFVAVDRVSGWGWIPLARNAAEGAVVAHIHRILADRPDAPYVSAGCPLPGVDGFRRSHHQALSARAVATAAGTPARHVTAANEPGLPAAALLGQNVARARAWVHEILGPLATDSDNDARLRETLRIFLRHGNYKTAAEDLNLHFNSVKYRVLRATERRGKPVTDDRLDVELALLICHWFGSAVLEPERK
jgi:GGDEF-like domain/PucR C-terminal helix-turn-helix domain